MDIPAWVLEDWRRDLAAAERHSGEYWRGRADALRDALRAADRAEAARVPAPTAAGAL